MSKTRQASEAIRAILDQGGDPRRYRKGLAETYGLDLAVIDDLIAATGDPIEMDAETAAQIRLQMEHSEARRRPETYRRWSHEEQ